jgi:hypothetical protein
LPGGAATWHNKPALLEIVDTDAQPTPPAPEDKQPTASRRVPVWAYGAAIGGLLGALAALLLFMRGPASPITRTGELFVDSDPPGASVSVDGEFRGETPLGVTTSGGAAPHTVLVSLDGFRPVEQQVTVAPGGSERLSLRLEPLPAALKLESDPVGAEVSLDGRHLGRTPLELQDLPPGQRSLSLSLAGHAAWSGSLELAPGVTLQRAIRLEPLPSTLAVTTTVPDARVLLDGQVRGQAPLTITGLKSASYELRIETLGQRDWVAYLWLAPGETRQVAVDLSPPKLTERVPEPPAHGIAVVVENQEDARPQTGLDRADVVYEAMAEGGISRFLALFLTQDAPIIGPVRSARHYFVNWAHEYDAAFIHIGASPQGFAALARFRMPNLDEAAGHGGFWRSRERYAPHNAYTGVNGIAGTLNGRLPKGSWGGLKFKEPDWRYPGEQVARFLVDYGWKYRVEWLYEPESNTYRRNMAEAPHLDAQTGKQLRAASVVALRVPAWIIDSEGRLDMAMTGTGQADFFIDGVHLKGSWKRESLNDATTYLDAEGREVHFTTGPLWIQVLPGNAQLEY